MSENDSRTAGVEVATLLGHRGLEVSVACLASMLALSSDPLRLRIHEDGSLTPEDWQLLTERLHPSRMVRRAEADERARDELRAFPEILRLRDENVLALKLVDVVLFCEGPELAYVDSDVLFLRPFSRLFHVAETNAAALFMEDRQQAYSVRSWQALRHRRLALPSRVNTGILDVRREVFDADLVEWYLARRELRVTPAWVEQTAWALLGQRAGCRVYDRAQVRIPLPGAQLTGQSVAFHFTSTVRSGLRPFLERSDAHDTKRESPVRLRSVPAGRCTPLDLFLTELSRFVTRRVLPRLGRPR